MLTIRLQRKGKKNQPFFKIVVCEEKKSSTGGRFVEELGFFNPLTKEKSIKGERAKYWISVGAKPSDTMHNMLISEGILEGKKIPKHKKSKKEQPETQAVPAAPETAQAMIAKEEKPAGEPAKPKEKAPEEKPAETLVKEPSSQEAKEKAPDGVDKS
jgi:small subunit ribosomal protein S16